MVAWSERLRTVRYPGNGKVAHLVETPSPGVHAVRSAVEVVVGRGFAGDHERKSYYRGRYVEGREVSAVASEVLEVLGIEPVVVGDNLITAGVDLARLEPGDRLCFGEVVLRRSEREHRPCTVFRDRTSQEAFEVVSRERFRGALFVVERGGMLRTGEAFSVVYGPNSPEFRPT